uniref:nose resistant to fluoxetine protein 6-like n=1 Tax=Styela clava TaxID=7725 RepID=UPI001939C576|nr:nose resistant to fluoxetine protein 6-like [Styela clava]
MNRPGVFILFTLIALATTPVRSHLRYDTPVNVVGALKDRLEWGQQHSYALEEFSKFKMNFMGKKHLASLLGDKENTTICAEDLLQLIGDTIHLKGYAFKMLDSWGKLDSGIATGNLMWLGRYYECLAQSTDKFNGKYCGMTVGKADSASFGMGSRTSLLFGTCLPDSCSTKDFNDLFAPLGKVIKQPVSAYCPVQRTKYKATDIIAIFISCFLGSLVILASIYDFYLTVRPVQGYDQLLFDNQEVHEIENSNPSVLKQLILSFSIIKNTKALLDTSQKDGNINVLHGIRFLSMTWVILGHTFLFSPSYIDNPVDYAQYYITKGSFQAVGNAFFSVDSFFFLSGLLATYLGMREMRKRNGRLSVLLPYLYRYLRLTPAYGFCILITTSLYSKMGQGPLWPIVTESFRKPCENHWWTNFLYINNMYPINMGDSCFGWGWYLANDTQFFLLSPFILWILFKSPIIGMSILGLGTVASMSITGGISSHYELQPQSLGVAVLCHSIFSTTNPNNSSLPMFSAHNSYNDEITTAAPTGPPVPSKADMFWSDIYEKPWCRIGVYFIGMVTGYILYTKKLKIHMNKIFVLVMWMAITAIALADVYGQTGNVIEGRLMPVGVAAFYNAISRPLWGLCLAWLVIACSSGYGGPINSFLSWKLFIPLSRLTYCAYLVHPLVIEWLYGTVEVTWHFSIPDTAAKFIAITSLAYAIAYVVSVLIEMPMVGIIKAILRGGNQQPRVPNHTTALVNEATENHSKA